MRKRPSFGRRNRRRILSKDGKLDGQFTSCFETSVSFTRSERIAEKVARTTGACQTIHKKGYWMMPANLIVAGRHHNADKGMATRVSTGAWVRVFRPK